MAGLEPPSVKSVALLDLLRHLKAKLPVKLQCGLVGGLHVQVDLSDVDASALRASVKLSRPAKGALQFSRGWARCSGGTRLSGAKGVLQRTRAWPNLKLMKDVRFSVYQH